MKNNYLILLLFVLLYPNINAQEFKLGKVSIAELEQKAHPKDSSAVAAILFKKGETRFEFSQTTFDFDVITEVSMRIKIYKKDGYNWANETVRFISGSSNIKEKVYFSDAVTYNLVGGKIEKTKLNSEGEFIEKVNKYWSRKKITLPNVKEGSVLEFKYIIRTNNIGILREFDFQTDIPINYSEYKTFVPEYYVYNTKLKGFISPQVTVEKAPKSFTINSKERSGGGWGTVNTSFSQDKIDYQETKTTYIAKDIPAIKEEAFVNNIDNYTVSLAQELSMTRYPNSPIKTYSTDWNSVVKTIYDYDDFGPELNKSGYFEEDLKAVVAGLSSQDEIISAVFNYVKSTVKWNGVYGYSCDEGVKKAYKDKTGNVAEINLMLTAMLRTIGLKSNPVLVSTRANGISVFPNRTAFNYVIAAVETPEGQILLDATSKYSTPNVLPFRDLNWIGRLIRKDGTSDEVDLMPKKASNDNVILVYAIDATGKITGKLRRQRTDHNAMGFRSEVESIKEDEYLEKLENENQKIEISDYSRTNEKDIKLPVVETCSFSGTNLCELIGEKIYINPLLFFTKRQNSFKQETREYPIDFGFPFLDKYNISIDIPEGFVVETLPKSTQFNMENNIGGFKFITTVVENKIQIMISHQINAPIVTSEYYSMLKEYYEGVIAKETEKIVLKKA